MHYPRFFIHEYRAVLVVLFAYNNAFEAKVNYSIASHHNDKVFSQAHVLYINIHRSSFLLILKIIKAKVYCVYAHFLNLSLLRWQVDGK